MRIVLVAFLLLLSPLSSASHDTPALMLARVYKADVDVSHYWVSEKLDGVRGFWDGESLRTRNGLPVAAPDWFTAGWPEVAMDGELWIGRGRFDEVSGIVRSDTASDEQWRRVRFMVFDLPHHPGTFTERLETMRLTLPQHNIAWLQAVPQFRVDDATSLAEALEEITTAGGEGLMLHHQDARYRSGRSDSILKYKKHDDAEARVVGYTPGRGKYEGMVGALIVEDEQGLRFRLGSGLSDALRAEPPSVGSWVTYRYNGLTVTGLPRFARFVRMRPDYVPQLRESEGGPADGT